MPVAKALARDWRKLAVVGFALFIVGASLPSLLEASTTSTASLTIAMADIYRPLLELYVWPDQQALAQGGPREGVSGNGTANFTLLLTGYRNANESLTLLLEAHGNVTGAPVNESIVEALGGGILAPFAVYYRFPPLQRPYCYPVKITQGPAPEGPTPVVEVVEERRAPEGLRELRGPGGKLLFTLTSVTVNIRVNVSRDLYYMCERILGARLYAYVPLAGPQPQVRLEEGRWPRPGSSPPEAAVLDRFAELMGWRLGGVYEVAGARVRVVGLYSYLNGFSKLRAPPVLVLASVDDLKGFMASVAVEAAGLQPGTPEWLASRAPPREDYTVVFYSTLTLERGEYPEGAEGIAPLASTAAWRPDTAQEYYEKFREYLLGGHTSAPAAYLARMLASEAVQLASSAPASLTLIDYGVVRDDFLVGATRSREAIDEAQLAAYRLLRDLASRIPRSLLSQGVVEAPGFTTAASPGGAGVLYYTARNEVGLVLRASSATTSPITAFTLISAAVLLVIIGLRASAQALHLVLSDFRPYAALMIARGASPRRIRRSTSLLIAGLALAMGVLGAAAAVYLVGWALEALTLGGRVALQASRAGPLHWGAGVGGALLVGVLVAWRSLRGLDEVKPTEALRPVESLEAAHKPPRRRLNAVLLALALDSLIAGLLVGDPEDLLDSAYEASPALGALLLIALLVAIMFVPFAPAILAYQASDALEGSVRLHDALARRLSRLAGPLRPQVEQTASRLRVRLAASLSPVIMAAGVAVGASLAAAGMDRLADALTPRLAGADEDMLSEVIAGLYASSGLYAALAVFSAIVAVVILYTGMAATFRLIEGEVVVMRARGASPGDALRFTYGALLPPAAHAALSSLAVAGLVLLSVDAASRLLQSMAVGRAAAHLPPAAGHLTLILAPLLYALLLLVPLLVSYRVSRSPDIARLLRERRMG